MGSDAGAFARALAASGLRRFTLIEHRETTASTNDDAQERLGDPDAAGLVVVADVQTAGSGRRGRRWIAPRGSGLLFTAILPETLETAHVWATTLWTALGVASALERWKIDATLQWPNDILVDGRKICGILCIARITGSRAAVACGIGVNVFRPPHDPELDAILPPPIFLDDVAPLGDDARLALLVEILREFENDLESLRKPDAIARRWERRAGLPGVRYSFALDEGVELEGEALRIAHGGGIVVRTNDEERTIEIAEARVLR